MDDRRLAAVWDILRMCHPITPETAVLLRKRLEAAEAAVVTLACNPTRTGPRKDLSLNDQNAIDAWHAAKGMD